MKKKTELPNTTYAVLGVLSFGEPLSGYEVRKWAMSLRYFFWSPAQSQIYAELRRLDKLDYVTSTAVIQEGKPNKRLYQINKAGMAAFTEWINNQPVEPTVMKHSLALRLFFGHAADEGRLEELLLNYIEEVKENLGQLAIVEEFAEMEEAFSYPGLVATWSRHYHEAELKTADKILAKIRAQSDD